MPSHPPRFASLVWLVSVRSLLMLGLVGAWAALAKPPAAAPTCEQNCQASVRRCQSICTGKDDEGHDVKAEDAKKCQDQCKEFINVCRKDCAANAEPKLRD